MPISTPNITTALENSLDMCFSALYMHELHRKYHHGEYMDLDNVKEENEDGGLAGNQENDDENEHENQCGYNDSGPKQPLLKTHNKQQQQHKQNNRNRDSDDENENDRNTNYTNKNFINKSSASAHFSNV